MRPFTYSPPHYIQQRLDQLDQLLYLVLKQEVLFTLYLKKSLIVQKIQVEGTIVSWSSKNFGKCYSIPLDWNTTEATVNEMYRLGDMPTYYIDECGFDMKVNCSKGRSLIGTPAILTTLPKGLEYLCMGLSSIRSYHPNFKVLPYQPCRFDWIDKVFLQVDCLVIGA